MQIDRYGQSYVVSATTMFIYRGLSSVGGHWQINNLLYIYAYTRTRDYLYSHHQSKFYKCFAFKKTCRLGIIPQAVSALATLRLSIINYQLSIVNFLSAPLNLLRRDNRQSPLNKKTSPAGLVFCCMSVCSTSRCGTTRPSC
jgi:hypothetical protein